MRRQPKPVIAIEWDNENYRKEYRSMYAAQKDLDINAGLIKMCCDKINRIKSGYSKNDGKKYKFIYANENFST